MAAWHRSRRADLGLRAVGLLLCAMAYIAVWRLSALALSPHGSGALAFALAAIGFLGASAGSVMVLLGHHLFDTRRQFISPGDVVGGTGGEDLDLGMTGEMLGDVACVELGAAIDRVAVALNDDRQLHCGSSAPPGGVSGPGAGLSAGSATVGSAGCASAPNACSNGSGRVIR